MHDNDNGVLSSNPHACVQTASEAVIIVRRVWQMKIHDMPKKNADEHRASSLKKTPLKIHPWRPHPVRPCESNPLLFVDPIPKIALAPPANVVEYYVCVAHGTFCGSPALDPRNTIERTPSRKSCKIVTLFPCLFVKASTTIRSWDTHLRLALSDCMFLLITKNSCAVRLQ